MRTFRQAVLWWVRRDLRLQDNPALQAAIDAGPAVLPVFVLDPELLRGAGDVRTGWLQAALTVLDADLREVGAPGLSVVEGDPRMVLPAVAGEVGATEVHVSADYGPYGRRRDAAVSAALAAIDVALHDTGSPYAVAPGRLRTLAGQPFQVFGPFYRAWADLEPTPPVRASGLEAVDWLGVGDGLPFTADPELVQRAGERVALANWHVWLEHGLADYPRHRDEPGPDHTSHLSIGLRWGHLHPRTVLADLAAAADDLDKAAQELRRQLAWREFFADVLYHRPDAVSRPLRTEYARLVTDDPASDPVAAERLLAWQQGRTGYPLVDAGMRQLLAEGWMHNRVRMVVASFLVKDLHLGWWHGARWFMAKLRDGDIAQNQLNWQWVAGCGSDAAPFFRIFNPVAQARRFDHDGSYVHRYVPELRSLVGRHLLEPWTTPGGPPGGYPGPLVNHDDERREALRRVHALGEDG
jgi:deoxyribodipyrimidine photo-lyase